MTPFLRKRPATKSPSTQEGVVVNPWRMRTRVTVVGSVCLSVCVCVCVSINILPLERLFILKTISCTQRATKVVSTSGACASNDDVGNMRTR